MTFFSAQLIDTNIFNIFKSPVFEPPVNRCLNSTTDGVPAGTEDFCDLGPRQSFCPLGQKPFVGTGNLFLAVRPGDQFDGYTATVTIDTPHRIGKVNLKYPQWYVFEQPPIKMIIAGPFS